MFDKLAKLMFVFDEDDVDELDKRDEFDTIDFEDFWEVVEPADRVIESCCCLSFDFNVVVSSSSSSKAFS